MYSLERLILTLYLVNNDVTLKAIDRVELTYFKTIQGHIVFEDEFEINLIIFDGEYLAKVAWNKVSRTNSQAFYKIKSRQNFIMPAFIITGEKYIINDALCSSFLIFSANSDIFLGVLIEESVKFWTVTCETSSIESALYSEELGLFYLNSREKSGFYAVKFIFVCILI